MTLIQDVTTREILNERGEPTLEADVSLACGALGRASVPANVRDELRDRDDDTRYFGRGVQRALEQVRDRICLVVRGLDALDQVAVDHELGTLERLGGNARLVVSMATAQAAALALEIPLHRHLGGLCLHPFPRPLVSVAHLLPHAPDAPLADLMFAPQRHDWPFRDALRACAEVSHALDSLPTPPSSVQDALDELRHAIETCGYHPDADLAPAAELAPNASPEAILPLLDASPLPLLLADLATLDHDFRAALDAQPGLTLANTGKPSPHDPARTLALRHFTNVTDCLRAAADAHRNGTAIILDADAPATDDSFEADLAIAAGATLIRTGPLASLRAATRCNHLLRLA